PEIRVDPPSGRRKPEFLSRASCEQGKPFNRECRSGAKTVPGESVGSAAIGVDACLGYL
ncbi:hypothetical protein AVEN_210169-1, partial [Araneus ventricosus]